MKRISLLDHAVGVLAFSVLASTVLVACSGDSDSAAPQVSVDAVRSTSVLTTGWRFVQDDALTDEQALSTNGSAWAAVNLPHTWNADDASRTDQTTPTSASYKRGRGWYRLEFDAPAGGSTQWLQFDGASIVADVWLNGEKLGQHRGAFTTFRFDVSNKLRRGQKNVLLVKTDNSSPVTNASLTAIVPLNGDFNMSGGLYRDVVLVSTPSPIHFALNDFGSTGVFARTTALQGDRATLNVRTKLENAASVDGTYTVQATLLEADARTVKATVQQTVQVKAGGLVEAAQDLAVAQPHLWQGLADPYLYKLVVEIRDKDGTTLDKVISDFGVRTMAFDPNNGFTLNGKSTPPRGVNMHQDYQGKAWAIGQQETDRSMALIKEIGANTLRLAHYPHARYTLEQADKLGVVVMAELPFVIGSSLPTREGCVADPEQTGFGPNAREQLTELIRQQYNHASIGLWSIGNEVTTIASFCGQTDANNNLQGLLRSLQSLAKAEDPSRITTQAQEITRSGDKTIPSPVTLSQIADSYSVNRYFLWYYGTDPAEFGQHLDEVHAQNATKPLGISEYGAGAALTHHTDNPLGGRVCSRDASGFARICYQPEGYASYVHEQSYATILSKPYLYGTFVWNMFDFGSGIRHEGDIGATNTKGLVTFDRQVKKDAFYLYKANWTSTPVTYITERRYTERAYPVANVKVYSNGESVTLKVNGTTVGTRTAAQCPMKICKFAAVPLAAGANALSVEGRHSGQSITDSVTWNLAAENARSIYIAAGQLTTGFVSGDPLLGSHRYGSDNFFAGGQPTSLPPMAVIQGLGSTTVPEIGRVWDAYREGAAFSYELPLANGNYQITLGMLDPTAKLAGARVFDVVANGAKAVSGLDIIARTGAINTATAVSFPVTVSGGKLKLDFNGVVGSAIVSNIAVAKL